MRHAGGRPDDRSSYGTRAAQRFTHLPNERSLSSVACCVKMGPVEDLGRAARPDRIVIVESLPRTPSGKVQRSRLPELVSSGGGVHTGGVHEQ